MGLASQQFERLLQSLGYVPSLVGNENIWKLSNRSKSAPIQSTLEILQRKEQFTISKCQILVDCEKVTALLQAAAKKKFAKIASFSSRITDANTIQCLIEVPTKKASTSDDQRSTESSPGTVIGWTISVSSHNASLVVQITDAFQFGNTVPEWWTLLLRTTMSSLAPGLEQYWKMNNIFEITIPIWMLPVDTSKSEHKPEIENLNKSQPLRILNGLSVENRNKKIALHASPVASVMQPVPAIEILEARETAEQWKEFDNAVFGRLNLPSSLPLPVGSHSSLLARIAIAPQLFSTNELLAERQVSQLSTYPLTAITGAMFILTQEERSHDLIKLASDLLRTVKQKYGDLHQQEPLRRIVPEALGDIWSKVDPNQAIKSWRTALEEKGQNPRIVRKIAMLANETGDTNLEFATLLSLCEIERRADALKQIAYRLIDLAQHSDMVSIKNSSQFRCALEGLVQKTNYDHKIVTTLAKSLRSGGEHLAALSLLELHTNEHADRHSAEQLSELHATIGSIWFEHEHNVNLATARYIAATTSPAAPSTDIFDNAEEFFKKTENAVQLRRIYDLRAQLASGQNAYDAVERAAKYLNEMGHHKDSVLAIMKLMSMGRIQQWYTDVLCDGFDTPGINWEQVAILMNTDNVKQLPRDSVPMWRLIAGRCAAKAQETKALAVEIFSETSIVPIISSLESQFVTKALILDSDNVHAFANFAAARLPYANDQELESILDTIAAKNIVGKDGIFDQAIANNANRKKDLTRSKLRVKNLVAKPDLTALKAAIEAHKSALLSTSLLVEFLNHTYLLIAKSADQSLTSILDLVIESRHEQLPFDAEETAAMISLLLANSFIPLAQKILETCIDSGGKGVDSEDIAHSLLTESPHRIARWHFIMLKATKTSKRKLVHAKQSLHYWLISEERPIELIDALQVIGSMESLSDDMLVLMESLCRRENKLALFAEMLETQVTNDELRRADLLYWAIRIINAHKLDPELSAKLFNSWGTLTLGAKPQTLFSMGSLWLAARNLPEAQRAFNLILNDPEILNDPDICLASIDALSKAKPERSQLATTLQTLISWAESAQKQAFAEMLISKSIELRVAGSEQLHRIFVTHFQEYKVKQLAEIAVQALAKADRLPQGVVKLLAEWQEVRAIAANPEKWRAIISCLTEDHFLSHLRRNARCELQYLHAKNLFEEETTRFDAIPHFEVICSDNPMDSRAWIPLYSLYEESDAKQKLIAHLERIIPLIERDKALLEKTPFNIESLKNSLRRARKAIPITDAVGSANATPTQDRGINSFDLNDHAARLQRSWIDAIPLVKISAVASDSVMGDAPPASSSSTVNDPSPTDANPNHSVQPFEGSTAGILAPIVESQLAAPQEVQAESASSITNSHLRIVSSSRTGSNISNIDWRKMIESDISITGVTEKVMTMAFASELEKHIAVQCLALIAAETAAFNGWHWQVWRSPDALQYSISPIGRTPDDLGLKHYGAPLHKLLKMISPIILRANREKFIIRSYLERSGIPTTTPSTAVDITHPALKRGIISAFESQIKTLKVKFYDTPGLGADVFFDLSQRAIHFDAKWQSNLPPSILSHRILEHLAHFQKGNAGIPYLNASNDITPVIDDIRNVLSATGISRLRVAFGIDHKNIQEQLRTINREQLVSLLAWNNGDISEAIKNLQFEMRIKAFTQILASTLDLVGIFESIMGRDLCSSSVLTPGKIRTMDALFGPLLEIAAKLKL